MGGRRRNDEFGRMQRGTEVSEEREKHAYLSYIGLRRYVRAVRIPSERVDRFSEALTGSGVGACSDPRMRCTHFGRDCV